MTRYEGVAGSDDAEVPHEPSEKQQIEAEMDQVETDSDTVCGIGPFKPKWLQAFANKKAYVAAYCGLNLCQGMFYTYIISVLTTVEKRFAVSSKMSGFMMTGNEFSQIIFAVFVAYYGNRSHRPRWVAVGMYISSLSCFILVLPEFVFPGRSALTMAHTNSSFQDVCRINQNEEDMCLDNRVDGNSMAAMAVMFIGLFVSGVGSLAIYSLGLPYMDDNVGKKQAPAYLGIAVGLRILGPSTGYMIGGATLRHYHDLTKVPDFGPRDPRWIGAWWLGFVAIGSAIAFLSFFMLLFPRILPRTPDKTIDLKSVPVAAKVKGLTVIGLPASKDLPLAIKRIVMNPLVVANSFDMSFWLLATIGFNTFVPKYYEAKFGKSASAASYVTGITSVLVAMFGSILGGFVIQRFKPRARFLVGYSFCVSLVNIVGLIGMMMLSCEEAITVHGTVVGKNLEINEPCNQDCHCTTQKFSPVCDMQNSLTYFTACHLGCTNYNATTKQYFECRCASSNADVIQAGKCPNVCTAFMIYVIIIATIKFLNATDRIGGTLIFFRSMEPRDKSLAAGMLNGLLCIMAFLPSAVLYGAVVDTACLVWEETCGEKGNCWLYDTDRLASWLHGLTIVLLFISCICEVFVWYFCKNLNLYDEVEELNGDAKVDNSVAENNMTLSQHPDELTYRKLEAKDSVANKQTLEMSVVS